MATISSLSQRWCSFIPKAAERSRKDSKIVVFFFGVSWLSSQSHGEANYDAAVQRRATGRKWGTIWRTGAALARIEPVRNTKISILADVYVCMHLYTHVYTRILTTDITVQQILHVPVSFALLRNPSQHVPCALANGNWQPLPPFLSKDH